MPTVSFTREKATITADNGANLLEAMREADVSPYRGPAKLLNCGGRGNCKTCKVKISPEANASPKTAAELPRAYGKILQMIDHRDLFGWRLACQVRVRGDMEVETQS